MGTSDEDGRRERTLRDLAHHRSAGWPGTCARRVGQTTGRSTTIGQSGRSHPGRPLPRGLRGTADGRRRARFESLRADRPDVTLHSVVCRKRQQRAHRAPWNPNASRGGHAVVARRFSRMVGRRHAEAIFATVDSTPSDGTDECPDVRVCVSRRELQPPLHEAKARGRRNSAGWQRTDT